MINPLENTDREIADDYLRTVFEEYDNLGHANRSATLLEWKFGAGVAPAALVATISRLEPARTSELIYTSATLDDLNAAVNAPRSRPERTGRCVPPAQGPGTASGPTGTPAPNRKTRGARGWECPWARNTRP